jgi:hypothetical protein
MGNFSTPLDAALGLVEELRGSATRDGPGHYRADPCPSWPHLCRRRRAGAGRADPRLADAPAARYRHCVGTARAVLAEAAGDLPAGGCGRVA